MHLLSLDQSHTLLKDDLKQGPCTFGINSVPAMQKQESLGYRYKELSIGKIVKHFINQLSHF